MVSKACVVGQYQSKLEALAKQPGIDLTVVVPPFWKDERGILPLERLHTEDYRLLVLPARWNGHFHSHYFPGIPQVLRKIRPDILHLDEEPYNFATWHALFSARGYGVRSLFFTWQNIRRTYPPPFNWMERYVYRHAAYAIAGNADAVAVVRAKGYSGPYSVIPQFGLDPQEFTPNQHRKEMDTFRIGFVGRLVQEKGLLVLLDALAGLEGAWRLEIIGSGPIRGQLEAHARNLRVEERLIFTTWKPSDEMPSVYRGLDLLVIPSLTRPNWKEQFGRVAIEAMASEVPVIASASGELSNVVGNAGILVPENDSSALRNAIRDLKQNPANRHKLGKCGRARVLEHYTQERIAAATAAVYREMLSHQQSLRS